MKKRLTYIVGDERSDHFKVEVFDRSPTLDLLVQTIFVDGTISPVATNNDHQFHAERIGGITAGTYNLAHELAHHLIAIYVFGRFWSDVLWRSAHQLPMLDPQRELEEWYATAITYLAFGRDIEDWGALIDVSKHVSPSQLARLLRWLLSAMDHPDTNIVRLNPRRS